MAKRPNQTDATLRNVRAAHTRLNGVARVMAKLLAQVEKLKADVKDLKAR